MTTTLFTGGPIRTGSPTPAADWVLVDGGDIAGVGAEHDLPTADRVINLEGATLVPAFRDAHVHLPATGLYATGLDFRGEGATARIIQAFAERAAGSDGVLFGGNFEDPLDAPLEGEELDAAVGERPALLVRADMHSCVVSSALLRGLKLQGVAGVDRDDRGQPTGYLREQAASHAWAWFERNLAPAQRRAAVLAAVGLAYSKGVAEAHEMFVVEWRGWAAVDEFIASVDDVALNVPIYLGTNEVERVYDLGFRRIGGDYFLDGSFGSHTAWFAEPYAEAPPSGSSPTGVSYRGDDELYDFFGRAQARGMQVGVHAIGDAAIEQAIGTWEKVAADVGDDHVRRHAHRLEHFECASDDHLARARRLGLRASVQPAFDRFWGGPDGLYSRRIGWERASKMNRFDSMLRATLVVGAGSDSTVTPLDPFLQMASLRRHSVDEQSLDAATALRLSTVGPAELAPLEGPRGLIAPGAWADFALLDRDPLESEPDELVKTEVLGTWITGERVWPEPEAEAR
jgi:predicted amidohydrolase YtcJ